MRAPIVAAPPPVLKVMSKPSLSAVDGSGSTRRGMESSHQALAVTSSRTGWYIVFCRTSRCFSMHLRCVGMLLLATSLVPSVA